MDELYGWGHRNASEQQRREIAGRLVDDALGKVRQPLVEAVASFIGNPITAMNFFTFEMLLLNLVRELGRVLLQTVLQSLTPSDPGCFCEAEDGVLAKQLHYQGEIYSRRAPTRNAHIATRFGNIVLWRHGYGRRDETIFPLEMMLGLTHSVSPALLDLLGKKLASAGMSQQATLAVIKELCGCFCEAEDGISMGVKRLRKCLESLAESMESLRESAQVDRLLQLLKAADASSGSRKPVLSVGRDGITLRQYQYGFFEVAAAATVSVFCFAKADVYDRAGKRLGTVYLAYPPESEQPTMDRMLTDLLTNLLREWTSASAKQKTGPLPRLAYVTDCGSNEVNYYRRLLLRSRRRVLKKMKHPVTGQRLKWKRIVDIFHVSEYIWAMADALFDKEHQQQAWAWAERMTKNLKRPNGASRVLHSAASLYHRRRLGKTRDENFWKAYRFLQRRTQFFKYHDYTRQHLPIGSGVTEAACKTIFTQRLKLSGMRWSHDGAKRILTLRTILMSGTWEATYQSHLQETQDINIRPYQPNRPKVHKKAA